MKKSYMHWIPFCLMTCLLFTCKKEYDHPPLKEVKDGSRITINALKGRLNMMVSSYRFKGGDTNLYCTVLSDELSGSFYQQVFVKDESGGAIQLNLKESGGLYCGDKIRINLNDLYLVSANNMIYLDSVDVGKNVVKLSSGNSVIPKTVSISDILSYSTSPTHSLSLQSQLVKINTVEFRTNSLTPTFADAIGKTSVNQTLTSCESGQLLIVRCSGRSNFAGRQLPQGNGSITGIVSQYNSTMQLTLREYADVNMNGPKCSAPTSTQATGVLLYKDFNDLSISSGGWTNYASSNTSVNWLTGTSTSNPGPFAKISGYINGNVNSETWLISPVVNLSTARNPVLSFQTAAKYSGTALDVLVSTNYSSGNPSSASWTSLSPNFGLSPASGDYLWSPSGFISLSAYKQPGLRIAFKYKSTTTGATSYQLDDIVVKEK